MFLGVTDQGYVSGFMLSSYQMDHFELALADLLARYTPPVPAEAVRIAFVPVKESAGDKHRVDPLGFRIKPNRRHVLRNSKYCWLVIYVSTFVQLTLRIKSSTYAM